MDADSQVRLIATETLEGPIESVKMIRARRTPSGTYTLFEIVSDGRRFYAIDIYTDSHHAAMMADNEHIQEIFGFEALPD